MNFFLIFLLVHIVSPSPQSCQKLLINLLIETQFNGLISLLKESAPYISLSGKKYVNEFGLYDACLRQNFSYSSLVLTSPVGRGYLGLCHSERCSSEDLNSERTKETIKFFLNQSGIADLLNISTSDVNMEVINPEEPLENNFSGMYCTLFICLILLLTVLALPIMQLIFNFKIRKQRYNTMYQKNKGNIQSSVISDDDLLPLSKENLKETLLYEPKDSLLMRILKDFSILENYRQLVTFKTVDPNLTIFDGFRTIAFIMVIFGHQYSLLSGVTYQTELYRVYKSWTFLNLLNMLYSVDIFFWIGGFFVGYVLFEFKKCEQIRKKPTAMFMIILHRLLRIWPCYLLAIMLDTYVAPHVGEGPRWFQAKGGFECKTGWRNFLFIDNLFNDNYYCFGWGWYLSNDIQMFLISLAPLYVYATIKRSYGKGLVALLLISSQLIGTIITYHYGFLLPAFSMMDPNQGYYYYIKPYCRAPPYFLGLLIGILYREHKSFQQRSEGGVPFLSSLKLKLKHRKARILFRCFCYGGGHCLILFLWFGWRGPQKRNDPGYWPESVQSLWFAFCRITFLIGLSLIALPNMLGLQDFFNSAFMSNKLTKFLAKISFTGYLLHFIFILITMSTFYQTPSFNFENNFTYFVGDFVLTTIFATIMTLMVEMPFGKLEARLLSNLTGGKKEIVSGPDMSARLLKY